MADNSGIAAVKSCQRCGKHFSRPAKYSTDQWLGKRFCSRRCGALKDRMSDHEIVSMYRAGRSSTEIAQLARISGTQVLRILAQNNCDLRSASEGKKLALSRPDVRQRISESRKGRECPEHVKDILRQRVGPLNHNWRSGLCKTAGGYLQFTASPANGAHAGRLLHQVIAEWACGRSLRAGEHVHHKDGNKLNNQPDNLQIMSASEHLRLHAIENQLGKRKAS